MLGRGLCLYYVGHELSLSRLLRSLLDRAELCINFRGTFILDRWLASCESCQLLFQHRLLVKILRALVVMRIVYWELVVNFISRPYCDMVGISVLMEGSARNRVLHPAITFEFIDSSWTLILFVHPLRIACLVYVLILGSSSRWIGESVNLGQWIVHTTFVRREHLVLDISFVLDCLGLPQVIR
jgi:hypothetical protein